MTYAERIASMKMETKQVVVSSISGAHDSLYGRSYDVTFKDAEGNRLSATLKESSRIMKDIEIGDRLTIKFHEKEVQSMPEYDTEINYVTKEN